MILFDVLLSMVGLLVDAPPHLVLVVLVHHLHAVTPTRLNQTGAGRLAFSISARLAHHLGVVDHHVLGIEIDDQRRERPPDVHAASRFRRARVNNRRIGIIRSVIPRRSCRIRRLETMLGDAAGTIDLTAQMQTGWPGRSP